MNTAEKRHAPLRRQLDAYAESWKSDHLAAQECFDWEDVIAVGLSSGSAIDRVEGKWRDRVFRCTRPPSEDEAALFREFLELWLTTSDALLARVADLEATFGVMAGLAELRTAVANARARLSAWSPPKPAAAVGQRDQALTAEDAAELDSLLNRPSPPLPIRTFDAKDSSFLS
jgi:hypothetical protein